MWNSFFGLLLSCRIRKVKLPSGFENILNFWIFPQSLHDQSHIRIEEEISWYGLYESLEHLNVVLKRFFYSKTSINGTTGLRPRPRWGLSQIPFRKGSGGGSPQWGLRRSPSGGLGPEPPATFLRRSRPGVWGGVPTAAAPLPPPPSGYATE